MQNFYDYCSGGEQGTLISKLASLTLSFSPLGSSRRISVEPSGFASLFKNWDKKIHSANFQFYLLYNIMNLSKKYNSKIKSSFLESYFMSYINFTKIIQY